MPTSRPGRKVCTLQNNPQPAGCPGKSSGLGLLKALTSRPRRHGEQRVRADAALRWVLGAPGREAPAHQSQQRSGLSSLFICGLYYTAFPVS